VAKRLADIGVRLVFSGLKHQVMQVMRKSGLVEELGKGSFFINKEIALEVLTEQTKQFATEED